jgi:hypothetical protein
VIDVRKLPNGNEPIDVSENLSNLVDPGREVLLPVLIQEVLDNNNDHASGSTVIVMNEADQ